MKQIKCHNHYLHNPSKELLYNIKKKKKLFRKFRKAKNKNQSSAKCKKLWDEYKDFKNKNVTKLSRRDRKQNIAKDLKAKSSRNDLKGIWKTIKMASNLQISTKSSQLDHLDENNVNKYFTSVGLEIQAAIPSYDCDDFLEYMPNNSHLQGMDSFSNITEDAVLDYIKAYQLKSLFMILFL